MRIYLLILCFLFLGCNRHATEIGKIESQYELTCLKSITSTGLSIKGDVVFTSNCIKYECFNITYKLGKRYFQYEILKKEVADFSKCE